MNKGQIASYTVILWSAVSCYVLASLLNTYGTVFGKEVYERRGLAAALAGLVAHAAGIVYWWTVVGHVPYMSRNEVVSSDAWVMMAAFLVFSRLYPKVGRAAVIVFPSVFLLIALSIIFTPEVRTLTPIFFSVWLIFHIGFYKIALGTIIIALAFSIFYILKKRTRFNWLQRLPELPVIDLYAYRFAGFGFIFWAIAMLAGSIWAYNAWGRFWGWDPVETWSLITWIVFGIYLHLRRFFRLGGEGAASFYVFCFVVTIITMFFATHSGLTVHIEYFR